MKHRTKGIAQSQRILFLAFAIFRFFYFAIFSYYFFEIAFLHRNFAFDSFSHFLWNASVKRCTLSFWLKDSLSKLYSLDERFNPEFEEIRFPEGNLEMKNTENGVAKSKCAIVQRALQFKEQMAASYHFPWDKSKFVNSG